MLVWAVVIGSLALLLVALYLDGRRRESKVLHDWQLALTPRGQQELDSATARVGTELELLDLTYGAARQAYERGSLTDALDLLDHGCGLIERYCPSMFRMLAAMSVLSRMVAAMAPVRPLRPASFRLRHLTEVAYLNSFVHHFLVTTAERFRLRVYMLQRGFLLLSRVTLRTTRLARLLPRPPWDEVEAIRADAHTLTSESLESLRTLLISFAADRAAPS